MAEAVFGTLAVARGMLARTLAEQCRSMASIELSACHAPSGNAAGLSPQLYEVWCWTPARRQEAPAVFAGLLMRASPRQTRRYGPPGARMRLGGR